jgi:hypothetical protein
LIWGEALLKYIAPVLLPKLLDDITPSVNEDVSHITASILVAGYDEIPGITGIRLKRVRECHRFTLGITEEDERLACLERVDDSVFFARSVCSHLVWRCSRFSPHDYGLS